MVDTYAEIIRKFKDREIKAKEIFDIREIQKKEAYDFVRAYHYLGDKKFFSKINYGLFLENELVGVSTFSSPQGNVALKGWFGITDNKDQTILELSRLAMLPDLNGTNATSYLLGNSIKLLHRDHGIRAVITLASSDRHVGSIYQNCNFKYYGMTSPKKDFYPEECGDGVQFNRGKLKHLRGVWVPRPRKHRYAYIMDRHLRCLYKEEPRPKKDVLTVRECCGGLGYITDRRFGVRYQCPICTTPYDGRLIVCPCP